MEGGGAREIVTTEWRLPPAAGAGADDRVARKAASLMDPAVLPSEPCSERRRTWLAVIPEVHAGVGRECFLISR